MINDTPENNPNMILLSTYLEDVRELKKEIIRLRSLTRRAAEEIKLLDTDIIKIVEAVPEAAKVIGQDEDDLWAGQASINLLDRLTGIRGGGYVENYEDLCLEFMKLSACDQSSWLGELLTLYKEEKYEEFISIAEELEPEQLYEVAPLLWYAKKRLGERGED